MGHDVFISYSHHDKPIADAICAKFESEGLRCWYAPRDIAPGEDWAAAIIDGIRASKVLVIVFTGYSNGSQQVLREIGAAVSQGIPIIPFKLTNTVPSKGMQYYLSTVHWLDAVDGQLYKNIDVLGDRVRAVLRTEGQPPEETSSETGSAPTSGAKKQKHPDGNNRKGIIYALAALVVVLVAVILWQAGVFGGNDPGETPKPEVVQETESEQRAEAAPEAETVQNQESAQEAVNTAELTEAISEQQTEMPKETPTESPTETPTEAPTEAPTEKPTEAPTEAPTEKPTETPTEAPTEKPTEAPTETLTEAPAETSVQNDYPELRDMSDAKKKAVRRLIIAGDRVYINFKYYNYDNDYDTHPGLDSKEPFLIGRNEQRIETHPGTLTDLSLLEGMDHLDVLWVVDQPLRSLDGIEKFQDLNEVRICGCKNLEDISAVLQLENLRKLDLWSNHLKAVGSFEKLKKLSDLYIIDSNTEDLSGLSDWDVTFAIAEEGVNLSLQCPLISDYSFLKKIPEFRCLQIQDVNSATWIHETGQSRIYQLNALGCFKTQEDFDVLADLLVREHPEISRLELRYNEQVTDLSSLTKLPNLTYVNVSSEMWDAICSLDGTDYKFELDVFD